VAVEGEIDLVADGIPDGVDDRDLVVHGGVGQATVVRIRIGILRRVEVELDRVKSHVNDALSLGGVRLGRIRVRVGVLRGSAVVDCVRLAGVTVAIDPDPVAVARSEQLVDRAEIQNFAGSVPRAISIPEAAVTTFPVVPPWPDIS